MVKNKCHVAGLPVAGFSALYQRWVTRQAIPPELLIKSPTINGQCSAVCWVGKPLNLAVVVSSTIKSNATIAPFDRCNHLAN